MGRVRVVSEAIISIIGTVVSFVTLTVPLATVIHIVLSTYWKMRWAMPSTVRILIRLVVKVQE